MHSEIIRPKKKVRGGVAVPHEKHTKDMPVKRIPAPETVTLPMRQHIGAPCVPTVKVGDTVKVGQVVGDLFTRPCRARLSQSRRSSSLQGLCHRRSRLKMTANTRSLSMKCRKRIQRKNL